MRRIEDISEGRLSRFKSPVAIGMLLGAVLLFGGCDGDLFTAVNPGAITEDGLNTPAALNALVVGVVGGYNGAYDDIVFYTGILSDQLVGGDTSEPLHAASREGVIMNFAGAGSRMVPNSLWNPLHSARFLAEDTFERLMTHVDGAESDHRVALVRAYGGLIYLNIAEIFCEAAYDGGPAVRVEESYQMAESRLSEAISMAEAAGVDSVADFSRLHRARLRLAVGDFDGALADAEAVPDGFIWYAHYRNAAGEENAVFSLVNVNAFGTVDEPYRRLDDPRVPVDSTGAFAPDGNTPRWDQLKYTDRGSDMPLAKWQDARLIAAEVLLEQGQIASAVDRINEVRVAAGQEPVASGLSLEEATEALRNERMVELFLEGAHRFTDMRRWGLLPDGWASCVPIPYTEVQDNPNLQ